MPPIVPIAIIGLILYALSGKAKAGHKPSDITETTPPDTTPPDLSAITSTWTEKLRQRAAQGAAWYPDILAALDTDKVIARLTAMFGTFTPELANYLASAITRWIGIESGGQAVAASHLGERGLVQISEGAAKDQKMTSADWDAMTKASTPRATHARIAVEHVLYQMGTAPKEYTDPNSRMWWAKERHALPLLLAELRKAGKLGSNMNEAVRNMAGDWKPSAKLAAYGNLYKVGSFAKIPGAQKLSGKTGLLVRFLPPSLVVSEG